MTDDDMDARLRAAGTAWRSRTDDARTDDARTDDARTDDATPFATEAPVTVKALSPEEALEFGRPVRRRRQRLQHRGAWLASAAAVAAVLVAGGGFALGRLGGDDHGHHTVGAESAALQNTVWQLLGYDRQQLRTSSLSHHPLHCPHEQRSGCLPCTGTDAPPCPSPIGQSPGP